MRIMTGCLIVSVAFGVITASSASLSWADCPQTCVVVGGAVCSTNASWDLASSSSSGAARISYDLAKGTSYAEADWVDYAGVAATDRYVILGPPLGTSVPIVVDVAVRVMRSCYCSGGFCSCGNATASLSDSGGVTISTGSIAVSTLTMSLPLTKIVGQPFTLTWQSSVNGNMVNVHGVDADEYQTLSFELPPGAGIMSCAGYSTGFVTAATHSSWGKVKSYYR